MTIPSGTSLLPVIDLAVEAGPWPDETRLEALVAEAVGAALDELGKDASKSELSLVFTDDAAIRELNAHWRAKDKPTNVLSFPAFALTPAHPVPPVLGDIVIAQETVAQEAALEMKSFEHHLTHLVIHGFLHLLGYDHETDDEADAMEVLETRILATLGIADPYAE